MALWTDEEDKKVISLYLTHSQKELACALDRTLPQVRSRCQKLGLNSKARLWTDADIELMKSYYSGAVTNADINLDDLAEKLGRHKSNVCRKAKGLGLTDLSRVIVLEADRKIKVNKYSCREDQYAALSKATKERIAKHGHNRGMLGKSHSVETKEKLSTVSTQMMANRTQEQKMAYLIKGTKTKILNGTYAMPRTGCTWKAAWREIGGVRKFYRSKWEANYAYYLQWLKEKGEITDWKHEPTTFWFDGVKRGCVSYLPDFWIEENNGSIAYHEVKGWMDDRSKTKLKRMAKYHPTVKLIVIDSKCYESLRKTVQRIVPGWEF